MAAEPTTDVLYRVYWKSTLTGATGNGLPETKAAAEAAANHFNLNYPYIEHWIEPVNADKNFTKQVRSTQ